MLAGLLLAAPAYDVADNTSEFPSAPQWPIPDPRLWILVYDPAFTLIDAYNRNYAQMNQIDANGASTVWLGLKYVEGRGAVPHYSYGEVTNKICPLSYLQAACRCQHCH
jgi:hypothetical protein